MYLGRHYIGCLKSYLDGMLETCHKLSGGDPGRFVTDMEYLARFQSFIEEKYDCTSHSWDRILLHFSADESAALKLFFEEIAIFDHSITGRDVKTRPANEH